MAAKRKNASKKYSGVSWSKHAKQWRASIKINRKSIHIGLFNNEHVAAEAFNEYVIKNDLDHLILLNEISYED